MGRTKKKSELTQDIAKEKKRIEHWRRTREKRTHMPKELWSAAVALARVHGVYAISQALRVRYDSLKQRLGATKASTAKKRGRPRKKKQGFIELEPAWSGVGPSQCVVELRKPNGMTMTIRMPDTCTLDVGKLTDSFWSVRR